MGGGGIGPIGRITDAVGVTNYKSARDQTRAAQGEARYATDRSIEFQEKNLAFQKEQSKANLDFQKQVHAENIKFQKDQFAYQKAQYKQWKSVYGELQDNLGDYYKNLDASKYATRGIQAASQEYSRASKEIQQTLAQRGISGGGVEAATELALRTQEAGGRAQARAYSEDQVRNQQAGFLGIGLGQGSQMLGQMVGQAGNVSGAFGQGSSGVGGAFGQGMSGVGGAYSGMANSALQGGLASAKIGANYGLQQLIGSQQMSQQIVNSAGQVAGGMAAAGAFSDKKLKKNITRVGTLGIYNKYSWEWNDKANELGLFGSSEGVLAQEVNEISPELISYESGYMKVNYGGIV